MADGIFLYIAPTTRESAMYRSPLACIVAIAMFATIAVPCHAQWQDIFVAPQTNAFTNVGGKLLTFSVKGLLAYDDGERLWKPFGDPRINAVPMQSLTKISQDALVFRTSNASSWYYNVRTGYVAPDTLLSPNRYFSSAIARDSVLGLTDLSYDDETMFIHVTWMRWPQGDTLRRDSVHAQHRDAYRQPIRCNDGSLLFIDSTKSMRFSYSAPPVVDNLPAGMGPLARAAVVDDAFHIVQVENTLWQSTDDGHTWSKRFGPHAGLATMELYASSASHVVHAAGYDTVYRHDPDMPALTRVYVAEAGHILASAVHDGQLFVSEAVGTFTVSDGSIESASSGLPARGVEVLHACQDGIVVAFGTHCAVQNGERTWLPPVYLGRSMTVSRIDGTHIKELSVQTPGFVSFYDDTLGLQREIASLFQVDHGYVPCFSRRWVVAPVDMEFLEGPGIGTVENGPVRLRLRSDGIHSIVGFGDRIMAYGTDTSYICMDDGRTWLPVECETITIPTAAALAPRLKTRGHHGIFKTYEIHARALVTHDAGITWQERYVSNDGMNATAVCIANDGRAFVVVGNDTTIRVLDISDATPVQVGSDIMENVSGITDIDVDHTGRRLLLANRQWLKEVSIAPTGIALQDDSDAAYHIQSRTGLYGDVYENVHDLQGRFIGGGVHKSALLPGTYIVTTRSESGIVRSGLICR